MSTLSANAIFLPAPWPEPTPLPSSWQPPHGWARWYAAEGLGGAWAASFYRVR